MRDTAATSSTKLNPNAPCWCGSGKKYKKCHMGADRSSPAPEQGGGRSGAMRFNDILKSARRPEVDESKIVKQGVVSPMREVPAHIDRPDYWKDGKAKYKGPKVLIKNADQLKRMRFACKTARTVLDYVLEHVKPGIPTEELDILAHEKCIELGAYPSPLNYGDFPKSICTSVNEVICHGIPDTRILQDGDIINVDVTTFIQGMHGDCSETIFVGNVDAESRKLVEDTYEAMLVGINATGPGVAVREIGRAIENFAKPKGYGIVRDFSGHGIGEAFHMLPHVMHYFQPNAKMILKPGMTFTVEPMISLGTHEVDTIWDDNWTAVTLDKKRSAQFEHTVLMTEKGPELLTKGHDLPFFKRCQS